MPPRWTHLLGADNRVASAVRVMAMPHRLLVVTVASAAGFSAPVGATDVGNADKGRVYAERVCAGCHNLSPTARSVPPGRPASFRMIADTPGMTATALEVWFRTPHPTMPNLLVPQEERDNVISFILSLTGQ
jgi:mono/diheme cytochrome c family protein